MVANARLVLIVAGVALVAFAVLGFGVFGRLLSEGFNDPSSGSSRANDLVNQHFVHDSNMIFLVQARQGSVESATVTSAGKALTARLTADPRLTAVTSYWADHAPALRSRDGTAALVLVTVKGDDTQASDTATGVRSDYAHLDGPAARVSIGGSLGTDVGGQVGKDIALAESVAIPVTLLLLLLVFGSLVSALLPLGVGVFAIFGAFGALDVLTHFTSVSIFAVNLVTALGLGLGIDYALLTVSRFREELAGGVDVAEAVARTTATAGRTIAFSALTVAAALAAMLVFPIYFLKSFAYAGVAVTVFAALAAVVVLPALLAVLGHRVNTGRVPGLTKVRGTEAPWWGRLARRVMQRPVVWALPVVAVLLALAWPLLHVTFSTPDDRVLPASNPGHRVGDALRHDFATQPDTIDVLLTGSPSSPALTAFTSKLSTLPGVQEADGPTGSYAQGRLTPTRTDPASLVSGGVHRTLLHTSLDSSSAAAQTLVRKVRDTVAPEGTTAVVGGDTADLIDSKHAIAAGLLPAALIIAATSLIALFLFTGSIVQPLRALVGNALTLAATLGVMVFLFQDGHFSALLGFTATPTNIDMPVLLFCVAFGLSMDYEVFLISRIKELHDSGASNSAAVSHGLARTGRIVSTAAALLAVSFFAFGTSKVSFIQFFGLGTGLAILLDATLVRGILVPASMRLLGERSWWAPAPLRRLYRRVGLREAPSAG